MPERMRDHVKLLPSLAYEKRERDIAYLMELKEENLLLPYYTESGLAGRMNYRLHDVHGGWDSPLSQLRGTFTGHFLSAAAYIYRETGHGRLKAKADYIVGEIYLCQQANGGGWAFSIPEKYLYGLKKGQHFWAPQYVCHKTMMGLMDMYLLAGNQQALDILKGCAEWFYRFTNDISRETMDDMMDWEETGGMMELWADLYAVTGERKHLELMHRYERPRLTEPLYQGIDVLTNMHANGTIAEILGCARAYEVTGEEKYRIIAENYWDLAVTKRGSFATGGGTDGEVWTPPGRQSARLSDMNQEHCVVYNMIRLTDYLYRFSGKKEYLDYIELNIENGLFAQGFWKARTLDGACEPHEADCGIVCYYLPLAANSVKKWGRKTEDFWCCHCTAVQANTKYSEWIYYRDEKQITIAQYLPSVMELACHGTSMKIRMTEDDLGGECFEIKSVALEIEELPKYRQFLIEIHSDSPVLQKIRLRIPGWIAGKMQIWINGEEYPLLEDEGYAVIEKIWSEDKIIVRMPKSLRCQSLADNPDMVAFLDGPVLLAGLIGEERMIYGDKNRPETMLAPHHEREWNYWRGDYKTVGQMNGFYFKPLKEIGREPYTVYFPVRNLKSERRLETSFLP